MCTQNVLEVHISGPNVDEADRIAFIPWITLYGPEEGLGFKFSWRQFPVSLAFAMAINKSQGQSLKYVGINLQTPLFAHGQLYVALSQCTSKNNIKVLFAENSESTVTKNIVFPEVYSSLQNRH